MASSLAPKLLRDNRRLAAPNIFQLSASNSKAVRYADSEGAGAGDGLLRDGDARRESQNKLIAKRLLGNFSSSVALKVGQMREREKERK